MTKKGFEAFALAAAATATICLVALQFAVRAENEKSLDQRPLDQHPPDQHPPDQRPLYQRIETPPAPVLTPADAAQSFRIAPGFRIEAVATEPLLEDPVAMTWDEAGSLYVAEMRAYMTNTDGVGQQRPIGSVVRLRDTNGDGSFDTREMMQDALVLPRAVAIVNEGLLIAEPPNLWLCPTPTGRSHHISCAEKVRVGTYGDQPGSVEHAENGLLQGLDNWLYSAKSKRRLQLRGSQLVSQPTLFRGQWGIAKDNVGRLFYNTNSNLLSGDFYSAQALVAAGGSAAPGLNEPVSRDDALYAVRVNTGVNRAYVPGVLREDGRLNRPTSASGMAVNRGDLFAADHSNDLFVAEPAANAVVRLQLKNKQAALELTATHARYPDPDWQQREFLASTDERFRPVSLGFGPEGALYVLDFYRGIIQDHVFISPQLRAQVEARELARPPGLGRLWRVVADEPATAGRVTDDLGALGNAALLERLAHSNGWQRDTAQRLLIGRPKARLRKGLERIVQAAARAPQKSEFAAVHALWTLVGRGELSRRMALEAARGVDAELARQALNAGVALFKPSDAQQLLALRPDDARFQQAAIDALGRHNGEPHVRQLLSQLVLERANNPYQLVALRAATRGQELELLRALRPIEVWSEQQEADTGFVSALALQLMQTTASDAQGALDLIATADANTARLWWDRALLQGLFSATRGANFSRVVLPQAHALFSPKTETDTETETGTTELTSNNSALTSSVLWPSIARARQAFTWVGDSLLAELQPLNSAASGNAELGAAYFASRCATCHGDAGGGVPGLGPVLVDSPWVTQSTERLARIVLHGLQGPIDVKGTVWDGVMPGHAEVAQFDDATASGLLTWLTRSWGHRGRAIDAAFVADIRAQTENRNLPWTAAELLTLDINTHYQDYVGAFGTGFVQNFVYDGHSLSIATGVFNGPLKPTREDHFLFAARNISYEFERDDTGKVQAVWMGGGDGPPRRIARVND